MEKDKNNKEVILNGWGLHYEFLPNEKLPTVVRAALAKASKLSGMGKRVNSDRFSGFGNYFSEGARKANQLGHYFVRLIKREIK